MKKIVCSACAAAALLVVPTGAMAHHKADHAKGPVSKAKKCRLVKRGFVVSGAAASFAATANPDGSYDGSVTLTADKANRHARASGVDAGDAASETFGLDDVKVTFVGVADGADDGTDVGTGDVLATDRVKLIGKVPYAKRGSKKNPCGDQGMGADRYGDPVIRKVVVIRPTA